MPNSSQPTQQSTYRPEIDGLRAISVAIVIAFHFNPTWLPGGYVGVDVFFVISGYLLTGIIIREFCGGEFSFVNFYIRRIRRILPALIGLVLISSVAGYFILPPGDYANMARSALYALAAISNYYFYSNTGYFDDAAATMPFLHTWSLGVEEQFYIVWPALVWCAAHLTRGNVRSFVGCLLLIAGVSFVINIQTSLADNLADFYLIQNRAWELALGGCIAIIPRRLSECGRLADAIAAAGLIAILLTAALLPERIVYPSWYGSIVVVGSAGVIAFSNNRTTIGRLLSSPPFIFFGRISYSLYLYHWPILVFWAHSNSFQSSSLIELAAILALTIVASWLSWRFIETPFRALRIQSFTKGAAFILATQSSIAGICLIIVMVSGFPQRLPKSVVPLGSSAEMWNWPCPHPDELPILKTQCVAGREWTRAQHKIVLWGDSNAFHTVPIMDAAIGDRDVSAAHIGGCSPAVRMGLANYYRHDDLTYNERCDAIRRLNVSEFQAHPEVSAIIVVSAWAAVAEALKSNASDPPNHAHGTLLLEESLRLLVREIQARGRKIVILAEIPKWQMNPIPCLISQQKALWRWKRCQKDLGALSKKEYFDWFQKPTQAALSRVCQDRKCAVVYPDQRLCRGDRCDSYINEEFVYRDEGHLRRNLEPTTLAELAEKLGLKQVIDGVVHEKR